MRINLFWIHKPTLLWYKIQRATRETDISYRLKPRLTASSRPFRQKPLVTHLSHTEVGQREDWLSLKKLPHAHFLLYSHTLDSLQKQLQKRKEKRRSNQPTKQQQQQLPKITKRKSLPSDFGTDQFLSLESQRVQWVKLLLVLNTIIVLQSLTVTSRIRPTTLISPFVTIMFCLFKVVCERVRQCVCER